MENRTCKVCHIEKPLSDFREYFRKGQTYYGYECRPCGNAASLKWFHDHRDAQNAKNRAKYAEDPQPKIEAAKNWFKINRSRASRNAAAWRATNRDKDREASRRWRASHNDHSNFLSKARRARVSGAKTEIVRKADVDLIMRMQNGKCAVCRKKLTDRHVDHIIPLALGGEHARRNLQVLCPPCNLAKSSKHPVDFMQSRGFLL